MNRMNRNGMVILTAAAGVSLLCSPALGQNLTDRINHVMQKRARTNDVSKSHMLGTLLYTDLTVQLQDRTAREALDYMRTVLGINIIGRFNDDRTGEGIDPDTPINIDVTDKPALVVLEMILSQCSDGFDESTWQLRDGFVEVGTKSRLGSPNSQEIRYYPIRDLLFEPPHYDNAPSLDLDSALSQSGSSGGGGSGGGGGGGGFGGGGGGGGGGSGGGGGGGSGSLFGDPSDEPERLTELEQAQQIVDLITEIVEPDGWVDNGGDWGTIRYYQGTLIIRAPDFMHRQINGYPFAIRAASRRKSVAQRRYVTFSGSFSNVELTDLRPSAPITGAAGGGP